MDRNEKKRTRDKIGQHLDVSGTRLTDHEASFLSALIDDYDETYRGKSETHRSSHDGWSSDGKFTRTEEWTDTFTDDIGIRQDYSYHDDDGQSGQSSTEIRDARGVLNWFRDRR
ncbi:hypothetical protein [Geodermatophilus sp. DSM 44513]|uniref:hypothetical protein n=1 Tax=Geodermatophilus sp. DSM 44513 TaxID=1528104 RepID=UPI0014124435|nr:hypothetical protein [Geodermatophilus sp. DSM 44513]WNV76713.1 hypothetical protein RTG05_05415 [Geodermatophilus sp. DSM 44513]